MTAASDFLTFKAVAAQKTLDAWRPRPMKLGTADCVRMTASHLRLFKFQVKLPPSGSYRTVNSALKALRAAGYDSLGSALDAMGLERIAPAAAIVGDIIAMPAEDQLGALSICLGNGRVLGYHPEANGAAVLQPLEFEAAWRVVMWGKQ
jgi:hypothetical protein